MPPPENALPAAYAQRVAAVAAIRADALGAFVEPERPTDDTRIAITKTAIVATRRRRGVSQVR